MGKDPLLSSDSPASHEAAIPEVWSWHYDTLRRLHAEIAREHDERTAAIHVARDRGGADFGDTAEDERENRGLIAQLSIEEAELREIEAALGRIRDGTYGRCEATGHPISAVRLRAVPWTRLSRNAAAKGENRLRLPRAK
jgi:RNA polymerase-binding transcription factor DksA